MKLADERRLQNQFTTFCTIVLKNEAKHIKRDAFRKSMVEKSIEELTFSETKQLATNDRYFMGQHTFFVLGFPIVVNGDILTHAIQELPKRKQAIVLLSYFCEMTDHQISNFLHIPRSTVTSQRTDSLEVLYKYLVKEGFEWENE